MFFSLFVSVFLRRFSWGYRWPPRWGYVLQVFKGSEGHFELLWWYFLLDFRSGWSAPNLGQSITPGSRRRFFLVAATGGHFGTHGSKTIPTNLLHPKNHWFFIPPSEVFTTFGTHTAFLGSPPGRSVITCVYTLLLRRRKNPKIYETPTSRRRRSGRIA